MRATRERSRARTRTRPRRSPDSRRRPSRRHRRKTRSRRRRPTPRSASACSRRCANNRQNSPAKARTDSNGSNRRRAASLPKPPSNANVAWPTRPGCNACRTIPAPCCERASCWNSSDVAEARRESILRHRVGLAARTLRVAGAGTDADARVAGPRAGRPWRDRHPQHPDRPVGVVDRLRAAAAAVRCRRADRAPQLPAQQRALEPRRRCSRSASAHVDPACSACLRCASATPPPRRCS